MEAIPVGTRVLSSLFQSIAVRASVSRWLSRVWSVLMASRKKGVCNCSVIGNRTGDEVSERFHGS